MVIVLDRNYCVIREEGEIDLELVAEKMFDVFFEGFEKWVESGWKDAKAEKRW